MELRIGQGFDAHRLVPGRPLVLGGVRIPFERGLEGHSDGDVLLHAVADALLGALGAGDLGREFGTADPALAGAASGGLLRRVVQRMQAAGLRVGNLDATVVAEAPRLAPYQEEMRKSLAELLGAPLADVNVKLKSSDGLGALGRGEGIAAQAVVLLVRAGGGRAVSELELFDSRTREKRRFEPLEPGHARVYSCGPTVYSAQHIGNLRPYLFADLLKRALRAEGLRVTHVINVTDVGHLTDDADAGDDKMELAARRSGRRAEEIAAEYTAQWQRDRRRLNCLEPEVLCRATEHIPQQIAMIRELERKGYTYRTTDGLYFDVSKFPRYAELARLDLLGQASTGRVADATGKRHPADFALWKLAAPGVQRQQEWDSPWGRGFPGWHIECSAMSVHYLGRQFDIHTGGVDHLPVHHTNELAQSECALDVHPWVQFWMHEEFLLFDGEKMAKSKGRVYLLDDLLAQGFLALSFRFFFLQAHYRKQQTFSDEAMAAADRGYRRLLQQTLAVRAARGKADAGALAPWRKRFAEAVRDDLNAPRALAVAGEAARAEDLAPAERRALIEEFDRWLGLDLLTAEVSREVQESDPRIDALVAERQAARGCRDFAEADRLRDALAAEGIVVDDTPEGPKWRRK